MPSQIIFGKNGCPEIDSSGFWQLADCPTLVNHSKLEQVYIFFQILWGRSQCTPSSPLYCTLPRALCGDDYPDKVCRGNYRLHKHDPPLLFDLNSDPSELYPLDVTEHAQLLALLDKVGSCMLLTGRCLYSLPIFRGSLFSEFTCTVEPLYCGHLGDLVNCPI